MSTSTSQSIKFQSVLRQRLSWSLLMLFFFCIGILFIIYSVVTPYTVDFDGVPNYDENNCERDWPLKHKDYTKITPLKPSLPPSSLNPTMDGYPAHIIGSEHTDSPFPRIIHQVWDSDIFPEQWRQTQQSCTKVSKF